MSYPSDNGGDYPGYPDSQGWLHRTPEDAIRENQRIEGDFSRGYSGGCPQDPSEVPNPGDQNNNY